MLLADKDIREYVKNHLIGIDPYDDALVQPASYDVTLGAVYGDPHPEIECIDLADVPTGHIEKATMSAEGLMLEPGGFMLGTTVEQLTLPDDMVGRIEGKSSLGRLGLLVHATAGFLDPGFQGHVTLEIWNAAPWAIVLYPGMTIAQIAFSTMLAPAEKPYGEVGRYQGQHGPTESRYTLPQHVLDAIPA